MRALPDGAKEGGDRVRSEHYSMFSLPANRTTHRVKEVNGLAFAGAAKFCGQAFLFGHLLVLPALPSIEGLCLTARNLRKSEGQSLEFH